MNREPKVKVNAGKKVLLIVGAGIAAYKALVLTRLLREAGVSVTPVLTRAAERFVTPLALATLAENRVRSELFDPADEAGIEHISLTREADLVVVAPATADLIARMTAGIGDDLATTLLLATDKQVLVAPAMNHCMWGHSATRRNMQTLRNDGIAVVGPDDGPMACGEFGTGRMAEPEAILAAIMSHLRPGPLAGRRVLVTSGPTHEPIDAVRYIANRSSGIQGVAVAAALARLGAQVIFISGPAQEPPPANVEEIRVETALEMHQAVFACLPVDAAIMVAAVADWRVADAAGRKISKSEGAAPPALDLIENPDILAALSRAKGNRPRLVVGFAAETGNVHNKAAAKRRRKGCDWILANDVGAGSGVMGGHENQITLISAAGSEGWPRMSKVEVARKLADRVAAALAGDAPV